MSCDHKRGRPGQVGPRRFVRIPGDGSVEHPVPVTVQVLGRRAEPKQVPAQIAFGFRSRHPGAGMKRLVDVSNQVQQPPQRNRANSHGIPGVLEHASEVLEALDDVLGIDGQARQVHWSVRTLSPEEVLIVPGRAMVRAAIGRLEIAHAIRPSAGAAKELALTRRPRSLVLREQPRQTRIGRSLAQDVDDRASWRVRKSLPGDESDDLMPGIVPRLRGVCITEQQTDHHGHHRSQGDQASTSRVSRVAANRDDSSPSVAGHECELGRRRIDHGL
jgi:hypothetical protein